MALKLNYHGRTDQGLVRPANEDNLLLMPERDLFVVCDGMGGHSAGEVASRTAVGTISATFNFNSPEMAQDPLLQLEEDLPPEADLIVKAIRLANRRIFNRGNVDENLSGMGTTVAGIALFGKMVAIAHVGDSRVYLYRNQKLIALTVDHSWVAEVQAQGSLSEEAASTLVNKNIITRALGIKESVEVDIRLEEVQDGDLFMLCSDGLCGYSTDTEIQKTIRSCKGDPKKCVDTLIQMANDRGGSDNITVLCVKALSVDSQIQFSPRPTVTIPIENSATGEREDEWLETLAEQNRKLMETEAKLGGAEEVDKKGVSRIEMVVTLVLLLAVSVIIYLFVGDRL